MARAGYFITPDANDIYCMEKVMTSWHENAFHFTWNQLMTHKTCDRNLFDQRNGIHCKSAMEIRDIYAYNHMHCLSFEICGTSYIFVQRTKTLTKWPIIFIQYFLLICRKEFLFHWGVFIRSENNSIFVWIMRCPCLWLACHHNTFRFLIEDMI